MFPTWPQSLLVFKIYCHSLFSCQVFMPAKCGLEICCIREYVNIKSHQSSFYFSGFSKYDWNFVKEKIIFVQADKKSEPQICYKACKNWSHEYFCLLEVLQNIHNKDGQNCVPCLHQCFFKEGKKGLNCKIVMSIQLNAVTIRLSIPNCVELLIG